MSRDEHVTTGTIAYIDEAGIVKIDRDKGAGPIDTNVSHFIEGPNSLSAMDRVTFRVDDEDGRVIATEVRAFSEA